MSFSRALSATSACKLGHSRLAAQHGAITLANSISTRSNSTSSTDPIGSALAGARRDSPAAEKTRQHAPKAGARRPRPMRQRRRPSPDDGDAAIAIFNDVVSDGTHDVDPPDLEEYSRPSRNTPLGTNEWQLTARIDQAMKSNAPVSQRLDHFESQLLPELRVLGLPLPRDLFIVTRQFLGSARRELVGRAVPLPGICLRVANLVDATGMGVYMKAALVATLCNHLRHLRIVPQRRSMFLEILEIWKSISQVRPGRDKAQTTTWMLPDLEEIQERRRSMQNERAEGAARTEACLGAILPQYSLTQLQSVIPALLITLVTITNPKIVHASWVAEAIPLLRIAAAALDGCIMPEDYIQEVFGTGSLLVPDYKASALATIVRTDWPMTATVLSQNKTNWESNNPQLAISHAGIASTKTLTHFHKMASRAHSTGNIGAVMLNWEKLRTWIREDPSLAAQIRSDPEFLDFWFFVFCAIGRPERVADAQAMMDEIGLKATIKTYTGMMHGWRSSRDRGRMNALWDSIIEAGIPLDTTAWTERISGLIELGDLQGGIAALAKMQATWEDAVKRGQPETAVKPTIDVFNTAFSRVIRSDRQAAFQILEWAGRQGIQPDVFTYNVLLRECFKGENPARDLPALLKAMKQQGIEPDASTFTILLDHSLGTISQASSDDKIKAVEHAFAELHASGVKPNLIVFGKMLHAVASDQNNSDAVVDAVLQHMHAAGIKQISPHMALTLVDRMLKRPHTTADHVEAFLVKYGFTTRELGDQSLWESIAGVYSYLGDTQRAMALYDELARRHRPMTTQSNLLSLLTALVENKDEQGARRVVSQTLEVFKGLSAERRWGHHFWHEAYKYGLLEWESAPLELRKVLDARRTKTDEATPLSSSSSSSS
ncbi:uncharacterized protein F5Z01DRAFT_659486 [Emericellopsis atlantica]|uniref:Pentatricopeptide repeat protein n=1 Tax=Emericellopsis atlantica TaxID=2614577 RepID=A0A9P7ZJK2_9HYPO|nr:uncharacterized protein F5Z01DRAFT_659486 [Emericellopsis atlantica]KAG9252800.1 hypothetical protein F5Z01DRAFT_659486 [Emericellopsis atlantica]